MQRLENYIEIDLTDEEINAAHSMGGQIDNYAEQAMLKERGPTGKHTINLKGKIALHKFLGLKTPLHFCTSQGARELTKVGDYFVRTLTKHSYDLTIDKNDKDKDKIILTTCDGSNTVRIHGWITASEGRLIGEKRFFPSTNAYVFLVSQNKLNRVTDA